MPSIFKRSLGEATLRQSGWGMGEIKTLTGLRGVAAMIVMLCHFLNNDPYFEDYLPVLVKRGYLGVDMFFVLSGFVMALSYGDYFKDRFSISGFGTFLIKRFARIYPLYFVITIIFSLKYLYNFSGDQVFRGYHFPDFIACLLMIQAWGFGFFCVAGATWSLSTEFFAYLAFPALAYAAFNRWAYVLLVSSVALIYLVSSSPLRVTGDLDVVSSSSFLPIARCMAGFCLGLLTFRASQADWTKRWLSSSALLAVILSAMILLSHFQLADLWLYAFFPPLVLALYLNSTLARIVFANRPTHYLGMISYSLYLIHPLFMPVKTRLQPIFEAYLGRPSHSIVLMIAALCTCGTAAILYRMIEVPGRRYFSQAARFKKAGELSLDAGSRSRLSSQFKL